MSHWFFLFMFAVLVAAYVFFWQEYLAPVFSESISKSASDVSFPSADIGRTVHRNLLGN